MLVTKGDRLSVGERKRWYGSGRDGQSDRVNTIG